MLLIYSLLFTLGVVVTAPYYLWRLRGNILSASDWRERLGYLPRDFEQPARGAIWVHAVSVGETLAVVNLVAELHRKYPARKIFMSHVTLAGRGAGASRLPGIAGRFLLPLDWAANMRRVIGQIKPALLVIVETELWPNLLQVAREEGAGVLLVNGRISDRSFHRYRWIRFLMRKVLGNVNKICAQSEVDAERFRSLGAEPDRVVVTGNLKFDARPPELGDLARRLSKSLAASGRHPVLVAASTMAGEEKLLLPVWQELRERNPGALLILAPRHPARFEEVARILEQAGSHFVQRTRLATDGDALASQIAGMDTILLDTIGELAGVFELADVVFMGGSLVPTGGHNVLEPAYWAKPIVFGPHMHNFRDIAQLLLDRDAAVQVRDVDTLKVELSSLFNGPERRDQIGKAARKVLDDQRGVTGRVLEIAEQCMNSDAALAQERTS